MSQSPSNSSTFQYLSTAERELRRWGRYTRALVYEFNQPKCTLPKLIMYGVNVPTGYYYNDPLPDMKIIHTQRIMAFMHPYARAVIFLHYVLDGDKKAKAYRLNMTRWQFDYWLEKGRAFYDHYRDTDFSPWGI
jgi:hypothetical protein